MDFVVEVYRLAETFPKDEKYNLISQLKRCAISIQVTFRKEQEDQPMPNSNFFLKFQWDPVMSY